MTAIPYGRPWDRVDGTDDPRTNQSLYDNVVFLSAWKAMLTASDLEPALAQKTTFVYDLVDIGRQAMAKYPHRTTLRFDGRAVHFRIGFLACCDDTCSV